MSQNHLNLTQMAQEALVEWEEFWQQDYAANSRAISKFQWQLPNRDAALPVLPGGDPAIADDRGFTFGKRIAGQYAGVYSDCYLAASAIGADGDGPCGG